ncbi:hypothetical protein SASPL_115851 [Salvia splendens]|uniref:RING-type domain-containing protein n=1 Tax=Salvia splendens TaxID=180675 RepID=A0A8X8Y930_SALSN|nr:hypothetical protein SASPL_115851 [Salvia splendens]
MEPPILRSIPTFGVATASLRRSYMCYNCNYPFHISPTAAAIADTSSSSAIPSSFRCPRCHLRHLISHHTICAAPSPPPPPPSRPTRRRKDDPPPVIISSTTSAAPSTQPCSICLEDFDISSDAASVTPCKHYFHKDCLAPWLRRKKTCPMCRRELPYKIRRGAPPFFLLLGLPQNLRSISLVMRQSSRAFELKPFSVSGCGGITDEGIHVKAVLCKHIGAVLQELAVMVGDSVFCTESISFEKILPVDLLLVACYVGVDIMKVLYEEYSWYGRMSKHLTFLNKVSQSHNLALFKAKERKVAVWTMCTVIISLRRFLILYGLP